jgi:CheY-like chemotaxis protein
VLPRLFKAFETTKEGAGTGLGLHLCRQIVERHKGTIGAENLPGGGACFAFTVPLGAAAGPVRILAIDDDAGALARIAEALAKAPFEHDLRTAAGVFEAGRLFASFPADLVVLDTRATGPEGLKLVASLRQPQAARPPRLLLLVDRTEGLGLPSLTGAGASAYLVKPFSPADFLRAAGEALGKRAAG